MANRLSTLRKFTSLSLSSKTLLLICIPLAVFYAALFLVPKFVGTEPCCPTSSIEQVVARLNDMEQRAWKKVKSLPLPIETDRELDAAVIRNHWATGIEEHCTWDDGHPLPTGGLATCGFNRRYILSRTKATRSAPAFWKEHFVYYSHRRLQ